MYEFEIKNSAGLVIGVIQCSDPGPLTIERKPEAPDTEGEPVQVQGGGGHGEE
jgi:hypothetical protein